MRYQVYIDQFCDLNIDKFGDRWKQNLDYHQADVIFVANENRPYWLEAYRTRVPIKPIVFVTNQEIDEEFVWCPADEVGLTELIEDLQDMVHRFRKIPDVVIYVLGKDEYLKVLAFAWTRDAYISPYVSKDFSAGYRYTYYDDPANVEEKCLMLASNEYMAADKTVLFSGSQRYDAYRFKLTPQGQSALLSGTSFNQNTGLVGGRMVVRNLDTFLSFVKKFADVEKRYEAKAGVLIVHFSTSTQVRESETYTQALFKIAKKMLVLFRDADVVGLYDSQIVLLFPNTENSVLRAIRARVIEFLSNEVTSDMKHFEVHLKDMIKYFHSISPEG